MSVKKAPICRRVLFVVRKLHNASNRENTVLDCLGEEQAKVYGKRGHWKGRWSEGRLRCSMRNAKILEKGTKLKLCRVDRTESEEPDKAGSPSFFPSQFLLVTLPPAPTCCSSLQLLCFWSAVLSSFPYKTGWRGGWKRMCAESWGKSEAMPLLSKINLENTFIAFGRREVSVDATHSCQTVASWLY